ncbi:MAG: hypothetical protein ACKOCB_08830 [Planctomycetia bacterium]
MPRCLPVLLACLLLAWPAPQEARAGAGPAAQAWVDLGEARVLASPGWPRALAGFLPPGRVVEPLALPLPPGPLLVLGVLADDPWARELARLSPRLVPREGLRGGWVLEAQLVQGKPRVVLLAEDGAALMAARFELETYTPPAREGAPRSVDLTRPDEEGSVRVAVGVRRQRPVLPLRALVAAQAGPAALEAASLHANRLWLPTGEAAPGMARLALQYGVDPVARLALAPQPLRGPEALPAWARELERLAAEVQRWQARGVHHVALELDADAPGEEAARAAWEGWLLERLAQHAQPGGLAELLVVLPPGRDPALGPHLARVPGALLGWRAPAAGELTALDLRRARAAARVPVVLVEGWMEPAQALPSLPRGREALAAAGLAGLVVLPGPGADEVLAGAWAPEAAERTVESAQAAWREALGLHAGLGPDPKAATLAAWLRTAAARVESGLEGRAAVPAFLRAQAAQALRDAEALEAAPAVLAVPRGTLALDPAATLDVEGVRLAAACDGERLALRLQGTAAALPNGRAPLWVQGSLHLLRPAKDAPGFTAGLLLARDALGGDPHAGRVLHLVLRVDARGRRARVALVLLP